MLNQPSKIILNLPRAQPLMKRLPTAGQECDLQYTIYIFFFLSLFDDVSVLKITILEAQYK